MYNVLMIKASETWGLSYDKKRKEVLFRTSNFTNFETEKDAKKAIKDYKENLKKQIVKFNDSECIIQEI